MCETTRITVFDNYNSILSFRTKAEFLRTAVKNYFEEPDPLQKELEKLISEAENICKIRNRACHCVLDMDFSSSSDKDLLYPMPHRPRQYRDMKPKYILSKTQIHADSKTVSNFSVKVIQTQLSLRTFAKTRAEQFRRLESQQNPLE